ncbi:MAG TPA: MoxR family ATPase [Candidatus Nanoarchaeia archaeon]|nr:MoxR family ATPase [Candidatus Nanoarchaeia archaeon]
MKELQNILLKKDDLFSDIYGQEIVKRQLRSALLTERHVIIVGPPGVGKTTLAKNLADTLKIKNFVRIQGSPDLTAEDLLGDIDPIKAMKYGPLSLEAFTKGKIFKADNGILFFDELNRCPEKLQNALLQVLSEKKATIGSYDVDFDLNFIFIGTMNPEDSSTEKLSDVLLDRFDLIYMSYPESTEIEKKIIKTKGAKLDVEFPERLMTVVVDFIHDLRSDEKLEKKPSVRASLGLYERAQANALLKGKKSVSFTEVEEAVVSVLSHRISLKPSVKYLQDTRQYARDRLSKFVEKTDADRGDLL